MIDTHCHLYVEEFDEDIDDVIKNAKIKGVNKFWLPAIDSSYHKKMYNLKNLYPNEIDLMIGLHPCYVKNDSFEDELNKVFTEFEKQKFIAIGEIGIDLYWDKTTLEIQKIVFIEQIRFAKKHNIPIVVHGRESFNEIFEVFEQEEHDNLRGIFHCFTGDYTQAKKAIEYGMKLGIGGVCTFKNGKIDQFLSQIPLENIVLETDSPYMSPVPFRGKRNEPSYLEFILEKLSIIYNLPQEIIIQTTTNNALSII